VGVCDAYAPAATRRTAPKAPERNENPDDDAHARSARPRPKTAKAQRQGTRDQSVEPKRAQKALGDRSALVRRCVGDEASRRFFDPCSRVLTRRESVDYVSPLLTTSYASWVPVRA
jgi:hypothetical protein